jgi:hypothetical protein
MNFHENPAPVSTLSAAQVRQPLHRTSLRHWKRYAAQTQALQAQLKHAGIDAD